MKKSFIYSFVVAVFYSTTVTAQKAPYTTENKNHELAPVKISVSVLNFESILTPITAGVMVEGHFKDKLFYNVQFRQGYLRNFMIRPDHLITTQKESKGTVFETGVDWVFSDIIKPGKMKVVTSSSSYTTGSTTYTNETYFIADCEVRKYWAISGGIMEYTRPKYINSDSSEYIISGNKNIMAPEDKFTHFNQSTFAFYGGLVHRKIKKAIVNRDNWNYRRFYSTKFYAQVLVGTTTVQDIIYNNQTCKIDNAKQVPIGYRIGWQWDQMGVVTGFEFGKMPGVELDVPVKKSQIDKIFIHNPYFNYLRFTIHFNIYNGDKKYHMKKK